MNKIVFAIIIAFSLLIAIASARAQETSPTEESMRELIRLMDWRKTREVLIEVMESSMQTNMRQRFGEKLNEKQERAIADLSPKYTATIREVLGPEETEPIYIRIYRKVLTQQEVDGMIA